MMKIIYPILLVGLFSCELPAQENWLHTRLAVSIPYAEKNAREVIHTYENGFTTTFGYQEQVSVLPGISWQRVQEDLWFWQYAIVGLGYSQQDDNVLDEHPDQGFPEPVGGNNRKYGFLFGRIEFGKLFAEPDGAAVIPSLSLSLDPYYQYFNIIPKTSAGFPRQIHHFGLTLRIIPGIQIPFSSNIRFTLQLPTGLNNLELSAYRVDNPILTETQRKSSAVKNQLGLYDFQPTIGLSFRL